MDSDLDGILVTEEFINGCKEDSTILDGLSLFDGFKINTRTDKRKVGGDMDPGNGEAREDIDLDDQNLDEEGHIKTKIGF